MTKIVIMLRTFAWLIIFLFLAAALMAPPQAAAAQIEPESTPQEGYPPPATPVQSEEAYPVGQPLPPTANAADAAYVAPTKINETNPAAVIGNEAVEATAVPTLPISQSAIVRNRAILWAGFLITLLIFLTAVYGAMLMYTRRRN